MTSETDVVRSILRQNEHLLRRHLVLSKTVLDKMKSAGLVPDVTRRKIMMQAPHMQVSTLLSSLQHQGVDSLRKLLDVLRGTGHGWLADVMLDTDVTYGSQRARVPRGRDEPTRHMPRHIRSHVHSSDCLACVPKEPDWTRCRNDRYGSLDFERHGSNNKSLSLDALLKARQHIDDPAVAPRGVIHTRSLMTDAIPRPRGDLPLYTGRRGGVALPYSDHGLSQDEIPMSIYGLNQAFSEQDQKNEQAMSVLRQEEIAIRQLMEQNARDQGHVRQKQAVVKDITHRLRDINVRANQVFEPSPHPNIGRYRLAQLNQIPWSIHQ